MFGTIKITNFAKERHFDPKGAFTKITDMTPEGFEKELNFKLSSQNLETFPKILEGYGDFCKLIVVENFTNAKIGSLPINISNYQYLRTGYSARNNRELPVLSRWFELPLPVPLAEYLVVVVYSKEQLDKEGLDEENYTSIDADWGIVGILGQSHPNEEPMSPITMMRNALGTKEGGSGVPLNKEAYEASVLFWNNNAIVKS